MAVPNMIVTLAMNATKYANGLKSAARQTTLFGKLSTGAYNLAKTAFLGLTVAVVRYIPILAQMGTESRKADVQLKFMLENMQGISAATNQTIKRMSAYADTVSKATGIDDEQIKAVQKKLLVFKTLRSTADELGGTFDRTTQAAIDLAAAGFGTMESNAIKLGRVLQDPTRNLNALNRAGITFTETEKRKITQLQESGKLYEAQAIVLGSVEDRVKGIAEASATPFEKLTQQFNQIGDSIGERMLPYLETMNDEIKIWLGTPQGKKDVKDIADSFVIIAGAIKDMAIFIKDFHGWWSKIEWAPAQAVINWINGYGTNAQGNPSAPGAGGFGVNPNNTNNARISNKATAPVIVNFNAPVDSVSAGRELSRVLSDYQRANGGR